MRVVNDLVFFFSPRGFLDRRIQMVVPPAQERQLSVSYSQLLTDVVNRRTLTFLYIASQSSLANAARLSTIVSVQTCVPVRQHVRPPRFVVVILD
jgi:hypothetical protein